MHICFGCLLSERPRWLERYLLGWYLLLLYGAASFLLLEGYTGWIAQSVFFAITFPWIIFPLIAATRPERRR